MKIKDCEVRMKVEPKRDIGAIGVSKGEKLVIRKAEKDTNGGGEGYLYFDGKGHVGVSAEYFEPLNKFEVGDGAIFTNVIGEKYKVKIWGISDKADSIDGVKYEISINCEGRNKVFLVKEDRLSPLKKPDELKVGDKVIQNHDSGELEITHVDYDGFWKGKCYVVKRLEGSQQGYIKVIFPNDILEIIYD